MIAVHTRPRRPAEPAAPPFPLRERREAIRGVRLNISFINRFIRLNNVADLLEFGCGDGKVMRGLRVGRYLGVDNAGAGLAHCQALVAGDLARRVLPAAELPPGTRATMTLSSNMLQRLTSDREFNIHIRTLFQSAYDYVLISLSPGGAPWAASPSPGRDVREHVRRFFPNWSHAGQMPAPSAEADAADFLIFTRQGLPCQVPLLP